MSIFNCKFFPSVIPEPSLNRGKDCRLEKGGAGGAGEDESTGRKGSTLFALDLQPCKPMAPAANGKLRTGIITLREAASTVGLYTPRYSYHLYSSL